MKIIFTFLFSFVLMSESIAQDSTKIKRIFLGFETYGNLDKKSSLKNALGLTVGYSKYSKDFSICFAANSGLNDFNFFGKKFVNFNDNHYLSIPVHLTVLKSINKHFSVDASIGYRYFFNSKDSLYANKVFFEYGGGFQIFWGKYGFIEILHFFVIPPITIHLQVINKEKFLYFSIKRLVGIY